MLQTLSWFGKRQCQGEQTRQRRNFWKNLCFDLYAKIALWTISLQLFISSQLNCATVITLKKKLQHWLSTLHMRHRQQILLEIQVRTPRWKGQSLNFTFSKARILSIPFLEGFHSTDHFKSVFKVTLSSLWTPLACGSVQCYLPEIWSLTGSISSPAGQQWFGWSTMSEENPHCNCSEKCAFK